MLIQFFQPYCLRSLWRGLAVAACLLGTSAVQAQALSQNVGLSFGSFVANTGGTITINPTSGRSKTGGLFLMRRGNGTAAQFTVRGTNILLNTYAMTLPVDGTVLLSNGRHKMAINGFTSSPRGTITVLLGNTKPLRVGATLTVGSAQAPGNYTGSFPLTFNYN